MLRCLLAEEIAGGDFRFIFLCRLVRCMYGLCALEHLDRDGGLMLWRMHRFSHNDQAWRRIRVQTSHITSLLRTCNRLAYIPNVCFVQCSCLI